MRVTDDYYERLRKEEIKDKITTAIVITALAVTPAAIVYKIEEDKIDTISSYYESMLIESNQASYLQGFFDGLFGVDNRYYIQTDEINNSIIETKDLIIKLPRKKHVKKLSLKNTK